MTRGRAPTAPLEQSDCMFRIHQGGMMQKMYCFRLNRYCQLPIRLEHLRNSIRIVRVWKQSSSSYIQLDCPNRPGARPSRDTRR
uniref:Uncharacterized protein n=1 Tax=uncultured marine group II/III euryarchaeote AD1000_30_B09 TaxID=1457750 RepID=A0A075FTI0_9EURY|nr:hypothetical protein [uncultured marine group II/III euryarchaeote AD1000_30_B09]